MKAATLTIGVDAQGGWPLPWLGEVLDRARTMSRAHALLVHGPAGAGQFECALLMAQYFLCEDTAAAPCGRCASCHLARSRSHPDLMVLVPDALRTRLGWWQDGESGVPKSDAKPSREIRVPQVRQAIAWAQNSSGRGRGKVLVLHPADALNATAANALLKTLEEPPGSLRWVLTCVDPEALLPTVRSRCQRLRLDLPSAQVARAWLAAHDVADTAAVLALAGGSPIEALALAEEGLDATWRGELPRRVAAGDASPLLGRPIPRVVDLLAKLAHDVIAAAVGAEPRYYPSGSMPVAADIAAWSAWVQTLRRVARHEEHPWNAALLIEALVTQAASLWAQPAVAKAQAAPLR